MMTSLPELAKDAGFAVSDLLDDDAWDLFEGLSDVEKVQWRYCHADCDDFALIVSEVTGWPVVGISAPSAGPLHRLVETPDGKFLDAKGWVTLDDLKKRYKKKALRVHRSAEECSSLLSDDSEFHPLIAVLLQLPVSPYTEDTFRSQLRTFAQAVGFDVALIPQGQA